MKVGIDICSIKRIEDILNEKFINKIINRSSVLLFSNILGLLGKSRNSRDPETLLSSKFPSCKI